MSGSEIWGVGTYRASAMVDRREVGGLERLAFLNTRSSSDAMALQLARDMECDGIIVHESRNRENDMRLSGAKQTTEIPQ
jgi:hypothetical protein